jgi:hypothetical protein
MGSQLITFTIPMELTLIITGAYVILISLGVVGIVRSTKRKKQ